MSKQTIKAQIAEATDLLNAGDLDNGNAVVTELQERRLNAEQKEQVAALVARIEDWTDEDSEGLDSEEQIATQSKQLAKYKARYHATTAASGARSLNNGDEVAQALAGLDEKAVMALADMWTPLPDGQKHAEKYERLNPGSQRMNAGNKLRGAVKRGYIEIDENGRFGPGPELA